VARKSSRWRVRRGCPGERRAWTLLGLAAFLSITLAVRPPRLPEELAEWPHGAVRWLLLPDEASAFARLQSAEEARAFIAAFWARRDPAGAESQAPPAGGAVTPPPPAGGAVSLPPPSGGAVSLPPPSGGPGVNAFAERFFERVAMADKLYLEEDVRGSLTDRGGALILLGPPPVLRMLRRKVPALAASRPGRAGEALEVPIEVWAYQPSDLPELARLEPKLAAAQEISLTFRAGVSHVTLLDGRSILRLAARAAVQNP